MFFCQNGLFKMSIRVISTKWEPRDRSCLYVTDAYMLSVQTSITKNITQCKSQLSYDLYYVMKSFKTFYKRVGKTSHVKEKFRCTIMLDTVFNENIEQNIVQFASGGLSNR